MSDTQRSVARDVVVAFRQGRVLHFNGSIATVISACGGQLWTLDVHTGSTVVQELASSAPARAYVESFGVPCGRPGVSRVSAADRATATQLQVLWRVPPTALVEVVPPDSA